MYDLIQLIAPHLTRTCVDAALATKLNLTTEEIETFSRAVETYKNLES
jgi:hypothetical protein